MLLDFTEKWKLTTQNNAYNMKANQMIWCHLSMLFSIWICAATTGPNQTIYSFLRSLWMSLTATASIAAILDGQGCPRIEVTT